MWIPRTYEKTIKALARRFAVVLLTGPRQVGKMSLWWVVVVLAAPLSSLGGEAELQSRPAPGSVDEIVSPSERAFAEKAKHEPITGRFRDLLKDLPPFLRDTELTLKPRTYYFYESKPNSSPPRDKTFKEAWAAGGSLAYESGWLMERLAVGAELFTSQKLYGPIDRDGTDLLAPRQRSYTVLGQAYAKVRLSRDHLISLYRQEYDTPYVNQYDTRMTPNTFEGYSIQGRFGDGKKGPSIEYGGGYIAEMKKRNSDEFISMSEAAGSLSTPKRGMVTGGGLFSLKDFSIEAVEYYTPDILNILYVESKYKFSPAEGLGIRLAAQFTDQRSMGDHLLTGSSFNTQAWGLWIDLSYGDTTLGFAFTSTSNGADMRSPWGRYPGYTKSMIRDFDQAGEDAFLVQLLYDCKGIGLDGLNAGVRYARGWNVINPSTGKSVPGEDEIGIGADYRLKEGWLKNLWFRAQYGVSRQMGSDEPTKQLRVILNYQIPLL